ncbi:HAD-IA family hydrolase [Leucobacter sp. HY1910]
MRINVAALLFDIDGTLVGSIDTVEQVWRAWAKRRGMNADEILAVCHGRRSEDTLAEFLPAQEVPAALAELDALEHAYAGNVSALPGTHTLLTGLAAETRQRWAAVTSGGRQVMLPRLVAAGLPVPDVFVAAEDVSRGKPDPEGYRMAAAALGVAPQDCLVLEDAPAGIGAGLAAGAHVLAVATSHTEQELRDAAAFFGALLGVSSDGPAARFAVVRDLEDCEFALDPAQIRVETK